MLDLQREQFVHDERFHREIARLSLQARLNHMALHFCKYSGQIATVCETQDSNLRARTVTDSFIISLCAANTLNFDLSNAVADGLRSCSNDLHNLGLSLYGKIYPSLKQPDDHWLLGIYAIYAGKMARACEKADHLETFSYRAELQESIIRICQLSLIAASVNHIDLLTTTRERRKEMRLRNPFVMSLYEDEYR
jgi:hypothetical protein